ncbi:MAG: DUF2007 domain-containing protein [Deltaproteobacteria bacterium]|nr:DUF2007 domain-containing protein [Deltaproteobacteria bacterium]
MVRVHTARNLAELAIVRDHLAARGIATEIRNQFAGAALGEIPWTSTWPELWVVDERDAGLAQRLIAEAGGAAEASCAVWTCRSCGEQVEETFARCWNCEAELPE